MTNQDLPSDLYAAIVAKLTISNPTIADILQVELKKLPSETQSQVSHKLLKFGPDTDLQALIVPDKQNIHGMVTFKDENVVPALPEFVEFNPAIGRGAGSWIDKYVKAALSISPMTPILFHTSTALFLASVIIARRLYVNMNYGKVYPNLYILWIAPTTLFRKTTALNIGLNILVRHFPFLLAPQESTPEALLSDFAGKEPTNYKEMTAGEQDDWKQFRRYAAQHCLVLDEFSMLMAGMGKDYNAGLMEALLNFHDCSDSYTRSTRVQGIIRVNNSYLSILGVSTPGAMLRFLRDEKLWSNGFFPRFALLAPETERPEWRQPNGKPMPKAVLQQLVTLFNKLPTPEWPKPPESIEVKIEVDAFKLWKDYNQAVSYEILKSSLDESLYGIYGRLPNQAIKIATILAALDWDKGDAPVITLLHMVRGIEIAESWRASAHRVIALSNQSFYQCNRQRILELIVEKGSNGITLRDLSKAMRKVTPNEIKNILDQMISVREIELVPLPPGSKGGRPTEVFKIS